LARTCTKVSSSWRWPAQRALASPIHPQERSPVSFSQALAHKVAVATVL